MSVSLRSDQTWPHFFRRTFTGPGPGLIGLTGLAKINFFQRLSASPVSPISPCPVRQKFVKRNRQKNAGFTVDHLVRIFKLLLYFII